MVILKHYHFPGKVPVVKSLPIIGEVFRKNGWKCHDFTLYTFLNPQEGKTEKRMQKIKALRHAFAVKGVPDGEIMDYKKDLHNAGLTVSGEYLDTLIGIAQDTPYSLRSFNCSLNGISWEAREEGTPRECDGVLTDSIYIYGHYSGMRIVVDRKDNASRAIAEKVAQGLGTRLTNECTVAHLTEEEKAMDVNIPDMENFEKDGGIFRYDPEHKYVSESAVRTSLKKALAHCIPAEIPFDVTYERAGATLTYRNKMNHIVSVVFSNSTYGSVGIPPVNMIWPAGICSVMYCGVNFRKPMFHMNCHVISQQVLDDFVCECMEKACRIVEYTDSICENVTELETPEWFE